MKREASRYRFRSWQLLLALLFSILLPLQSAQASDSFVGDGFGGRSWYVPSGMEAGTRMGAYIDPTGQLYMWGYHSDHGPFIHPYTSPLSDVNWTCSFPVGGFDDVKLISLGYSVGSLVNNDGTAFFWTRGNDQRFDPSYQETPTQILTDVKHVSAGINHLAFVKNDGTVWSIGRNESGQFGNGTTNANYVTVPVQMSGMSDAVRVATVPTNKAATDDATLVLKSDRTLWIAGGGDSEMLPGNSPNLLATQLPITDVVDVKGGEGYAVVLDDNGDVYTWGENDLSALGQGELYSTLDALNVPTKVTFPAGTPPMVAIDTYTYYGPTFALDETGTLWGWNGSYAGYGMGIAASSRRNVDPVPLAYHVADAVAGEGLGYLVRDADYPSDQRLWASIGSDVQRILTLNMELDPTDGFGNPSSITQARGDDVWNVSKPETCDMTVDFSGMPGASGGGGGAGTIADVAIVKSAGVTEATTGVPFDYTLTVTNNGPAAATNVVATDLLPAGFTFNSATATDGGSCTESGGTVTCSWATMANGATVSATINVTP